MSTDARVVALIPARGGSKGLPGKNIMNLAGRPLIGWSIEAAKKSPYVSRVVVSTDDEEIAQVARECGAEVPFLRPENLADDSTPTAPVLQHCLIELEKSCEEPFDIVLFLQTTDVFRKMWMVNGVIESLLKNPDLDTALMAHTTHKNFWRLKDGLGERFTPESSLVRQSREAIYREDAGLASASRAHVVRGGRIIGDKVAIIPNDNPMSAIDIHYAIDMRHAEVTLAMPEVSIND